MVNDHTVGDYIQKYATNNQYMRDFKSMTYLFLPWPFPKGKPRS